jgi:1,2-diacylglycerol 3-alpha-glucosyltransferase
MKILFVSDTYYPHLNGVYYFVCRIAPLLQERGHEVAVIAPSESRYSTFKKVDQIDVFGVPSLPTLYYPKVRFGSPFFLKSKIKKILCDFKPDIIHVQDHFPIAKATISVGIEIGIPILGTNHFMTENLTAFVRSEKVKRAISNLLWKEFSKVYNQLSIVTTPSEWAVSLIKAKLTTPVISISSGIDLEKFNSHENDTVVKHKLAIPDKPVLLFVGRLDPEKKIGETLEAVALALKIIDFCYVIVGKGSSKKSLENKARKLGIRNHVIFTGFVTNEDLYSIYRISNCFVISSTAELLSLATLQGMASGLPVIAVNAGALSELIESGENGLLYKPGDVKDLTNNICTILGNSELHLRMKAKSYELARKHDINQTVRSFEKVYEKTLENAKYKKVIPANLHFNFI